MNFDVILSIRSNLYGLFRYSLSPSIKKLPLGKLSSIFVSEPINTSLLPLIWSHNISSWFLRELIFKCAKTALFGLLARNYFRNLLQSVTFFKSSTRAKISFCLRNVLSVTLSMFSKFRPYIPTYAIYNKTMVVHK